MKWPRSTLVLVAGLLSAAFVSCQPATSTPASSESADDELAAKILKSESILVNVVAGDSFSIDIEPSETVGILKGRICDQEGFAWERQRLVLEGQLLETFRQLSEYNIRAGANLTLLLDRGGPPVGERAIFRLLSSPDGASRALTSELASSVGSLKAKIELSTGVPSNGQRLLLEGKELARDERLLMDYNLTNGTRLSLGKPLEACQEPVRILVKLLSGATFHIDTELSATVAQLKDKIRARTGAPQRLQTLVHPEPLALELKGHNLLCDHGLEAPSATLHLVLYSRHVATPDHVAQLARGLRARNPKAAKLGPVLREAGGAVAPYIHEDARNWIFTRGTPLMVLGHFDPAARLVPDPDDQVALNEAWRELRELSAASQLAGSPTQAAEHATLRARVQMADALRLASYRSQRRVAGLQVGSLWRPGDLLSANINNFAPDALDDASLGALFEFSERVRTQLTSDVQTGEGNLGFAQQRAINAAVLRAYAEAMAGFPLYSEARGPEADRGECAICRDELATERAIQLACGHAFHADCALQWLPQLLRQTQHSKNNPKEQFEPTGCPYCRSPFRFRLSDILAAVDWQQQHQ